MTEKDAFADRRRSQEEEYFRKREQELIAKMRRRAADEASRKLIAERTGITDDTMLQELQAVGYTPETVALVYVVPLVQTAWIDGDVSARERDVIIEAARARAIEERSEADRQLTEWLTNRPAAEVFDTTLRAIAAMLKTRPSAERDTTRRELLGSCTAIATASGGVLGFGKVSEQERALLARIAQALEGD